MKHLLDFAPVVESVYTHIMRHGLPVYQGTAIDVKTRLRFLAYSSEKAAANGILFMEIVALWLRAFGISHRRKTV